MSRSFRKNGPHMDSDTHYIRFKMTFLFRSSDIDDMQQGISSPFVQYLKSKIKIRTIFSGIISSIFSRIFRLIRIRNFRSSPFSLRRERDRGILKGPLNADVRDALVFQF